MDVRLVPAHVKIRIRRDSGVWNLHSHSKYSAKDALPSVADMVERARVMGQAALGLTDHGNMAGSVELYKACTKKGLKPFPGTELYMVATRSDKKAKRHHMCVVAYTSTGYKNLVRLSTLSHRNFFNKPLVDLNDLALLAEEGGLRGLAATSGCVSGLVNTALLSGDVEAAKSYLRGFDSWFDRFYVELQNHHNTWETPDGPVTDDQLADLALEIAQGLGLPVVLTQDAHYLRCADQADHDALKRLVSFGPEMDDGVFGGDGYGLADDAWFRDHHHPARYDAGVAGLADLLGAHDLAIPQLDVYHYNIPFTVADPNDELARRTRLALRERGLDAAHRAVLEEELDVIAATGMAGYLLLVAEVTDWCRSHEVFFQARGSAAGSISCWLLGITPVDPLRWGLSYERFISRDRTKPPDVDLDVEHSRRQELIDWLASRFSTLQIGNWRENKLKGETDPDTGEESSKGSLRVQYFSRKRQLGDAGGDWSMVPDEDKRMLYRLDELRTYAGYGKHAAGVIVTTTRAEIDDLVPQMYVASSKSFVSQYDMDNVEALGLVKLDVLGLKTLSVLHKTMDNMDRPVDLDWIPLSDSKTFSAIARGDTDGVFQLEGWSARRGCQKLKPTKVSDVIAAMALFRPATMDSGATKDYIDFKHKKKVMPARHPLLTEVCKNTYGILLFQEQVISVLRKLGMNPDDLTAFLKAVKASNQNIGDAGAVIAGYQAQVHELADKAGLAPEDWDWLWQAMTGFAAYGFNACITGDTVLTRSSGNQYAPREVSVAELYRAWHSRSPVGEKYRRQGLQVLARVGDRIRTDTVVNVFYNGIKPVYRVTLANGMSITATSNHRHLTEKGWARVDELRVGDKLATMGERQKFSRPNGSGNVPYLHNGLHLLRREIRQLGQCEWCGESEGRLEIAHLDGDRTNNSRENLRLLCNPCHKQYDWDKGERKARHSRGRHIIYSEIVSIEYVGYQDVYDVEMAGEDHSWVGNGIVTHNSHSTVYGLTAYRCAYLATHHPVEFHAALLNVAAGSEKEKAYVQATRRRDISILRATVDESGVSYEVTSRKNAIRKGLTSIKGVGESAATAIVVDRPTEGFRTLALFGASVNHRKVTGIKDLRESGDLSVGIVNKLYEAGALDRLQGVSHGSGGLGASPRQQGV